MMSGGSLPGGGGSGVLGAGAGAGAGPGTGTGTGGSESVVGSGSQGGRGRAGRRANKGKKSKLSGKKEGTGVGDSEETAETAEAAEAAPAGTGPVFFWKPDEEPYGVLGQWYPALMTAPLLALAAHAAGSGGGGGDGRTGTTTQAHHDQGERRIYTFNTCEQYMMAHKAHLFEQHAHTILDAIMDEPSPHHQKALGRKVPNFDEQLWKAHRFAIVTSGNYLKFTQNQELKTILLQTGDRELVEASPMDRIWGVGFGAKKAQENRNRWGLNLLGKALMEVRERIRKEEEEEGEWEVIVYDKNEDQ